MLLVYTAWQEEQHSWVSAPAHPLTGALGQYAICTTVLSIPRIDPGGQPFHPSQEEQD